MRLYPAIDIKDGQCVRLKKGLFNEVTVYSDTPYKIAESFEKDGAKFIHTVDLDGALKGRSVNAETIKKICSNYDIEIENILKVANVHDCPSGGQVILKVADANEYTEISSYILSLIHISEPTRRS